jgi:hypothetical protein
MQKVLSLFKRGKNDDRKTQSLADLRRESSGPEAVEPIVTITEPTPRGKRLSVVATQPRAGPKLKTSYSHLLPKEEPKLGLLIPPIRMDFNSEEPCSGLTSPVTKIAEMVRESLDSGDFSSVSSNLVELFRVSIMEDQEIHSQLLQFARNERNEENVLLFDDLVMYNKLTDAGHKRMTAKRIRDKYLDQFSLSEVNINDSIRKQVDEVFTNVYSEEKLDAAMRALEVASLENLMDLFTRFSQSRNYKDYRREKRKSRSAPTTPDLIENPMPLPVQRKPVDRKERFAKTKSVSIQSLKRMSTRFNNWVKNT